MDNLCTKEKDQIRKGFSEFIWLNLAKILFFLILAIILIVRIFLQFGVLHYSLVNPILFYLSSTFRILDFVPMIFFVLLCGEHCASVSLPVVFIAYLIPLIILWLVARVLGWLWDKLWGGRKLKKHLEIIISALVFWLLLTAIIIPFVGPHFVSVEKKTVEELTMPRIPAEQQVSNDGGKASSIQAILNRRNPSYGYMQIQELKLKNNFIAAVAHRLPPMILCYYNEGGDSRSWLPSYYYYETGERVISDSIGGPTVVLNRGEEKTVYLVAYQPLSSRADLLHDSVLLLQSKNDNKQYYCENIAYSEIVQAQKVRITR